MLNFDLLHHDILETPEIFFPISDWRNWTDESRVNQTEEREQLQISYDKLSNEKGQLQISYDKLSNEKGQIQIRPIRYKSVQTIGPVKN